MYKLYQLKCDLQELYHFHLLFAELQRVQILLRHELILDNQQNSGEFLADRCKQSK